MATVSTPRDWYRNDYPTSDGKPMAETDLHRDLMATLISILQTHFAALPRVYVSGNLLIFYEPGNKRKHVAPDVFVVKGVAKHKRPNDLLWEEGKGPDFVIELTSSSTRREDMTKKFTLYRDTLKVREYFLFDPFGDYLRPQLQGYRLRQGAYHPIRPVAGRLPSQVVGLHLEAQGQMLRLYDPQAGKWLPTPPEALALEAEAREAAEVARRAEAEAREAVEAERRAEVEAREAAEAERRAEAEARQRAEAARRAEAEARQAAEAEVQRLRAELEALRRQQRSSR
jgi:Uma2 family endonuclease